MMNKINRGRWLLCACLMVVLSCLALPGLAVDTFVIPVNELDMNRLSDDSYIADHLSAGTQYIRLTYALSEQAHVVVSVVREDTGAAVHEKDYGQVSGTFRSDDIYLKYTGSETTKYNITVAIGDAKYKFPFQRQLMLLKNNTACTYGVRIKNLDKRLTDGWTMVTLLDLDEVAALPGSTKRIDLCASNMYVIGTVSVRVRDDALRVSMQLDEDNKFEISHQSLYLITNLSDWTSVNPKQMSQPQYEIGVDISLSQELPGVRYLVMYLPMTLTYDPNGLDRFSYDLKNNPDLQHQLEIWDAMETLETEQAVG